MNLKTITISLGAITAGISIYCTTVIFASSKTAAELSTSFMENAPEEAGEDHGKSAQKHGETPSPEAPPSHGQAPAPSGHGAASSPASHASSQYRPILVSLDDFVLNIPDQDQKKSHTMSLQIELELFDESGRSYLEKSLSGVKDRIIQTTLDHTMQELASVTGKLFFKERLVSELNDYFKKALVRDIHVVSFFMQ